MNPITLERLRKIRAKCRATAGFAPAAIPSPESSGLLATIAAIDGLLALYDFCDAFADGSPDANPRDFFANEALSLVCLMSDNIIAAWEGVELP